MLRPAPWLLLAALSAVTCSRDAAPRMNVIVIAVDTLRADALGCYGAGPDASPAVDRFAATAAVFEQTTASAGWTLPSFASMFTGLYPEAHGAMRPSDRLADEYVTLAEVLADAGYRTAGMTGGGYVGPKFGLKQGFELFTFKETYRLRDAMPQAEKWIDHVDDAPFFLFLHGYDVHSPYAPQVRPAPPPGYEPPPLGLVKELKDAVDGKTDPQQLDVGRVITGYLTLDPPGEYLRTLRGAYLQWTNQVDFDVQAAWQRAPSFEDDLAWVKANYAAEVRETDDDLGRFLAFLEERGRLESTLVVLVSDHGEAFMEHGHAEHYDVHQEIAHVPLVVRPPGGVPGGRRVRTPVRGLDLFATILDYTGCAPPAPTEARSLRPLVDGETLPDEPACCFKHQVPADQTPRISIRLGDWKLLSGGPDRMPSLFDLETDPGETTDVAAREPEVVARLVERLDVVRARSAQLRERIGAGGTDSAIDAETRERLTELGYLGALDDD